MKNLLTLLLITLSFSSFGQSLANTEWDVYLFNELITEVRLTEDTFYVDNQEEDEFAIAVYTTQGDTFSITDLPGANGCFEDFGNVEGLYLFEISNDTLTFSVLQDTCEIRVETIDNAIFIKKETTSIEEEDLLEGITLFPNPLTDGILNINTEIELDKVDVYDHVGRLLLSTKNTRRIDLSEFNNQLFIIKLHKDKNVVAQKVFKP